MSKKIKDFLSKLKKKNTQSEQSPALPSFDRLSFKQKLQLFFENLKTKFSKKKNLSNANEDRTQPEIVLTEESTQLKTPNQFIQKIKDINVKEITSQFFKRFKTKNISSAISEFPVDEIKLKLKKMNWEELPQIIFSTNSWQKFHYLFLTLLILTLTYSTAKFSALLIKGKEDALLIPAPTTYLQFKKRDTNQIQALMTNNLFKAVEKKVEQTPTEPKKPVITNEICKKGESKSSLPVKLVKTIVLQDVVKSIASIQVRSAKKFQAIRQGEKIESMAKVDLITPSEIIVKNLSTGRCEYIQSSDKNNKKSTSEIAVLNPKESIDFLKSKKDISGISKEGNVITISRKLINEKLEDIDSLLTQARAIPITNPDGTLSFKIVEIEPGSLYSYLDIENEDIITEIGGKKIKNVNEIMNLFGQLQSLTSLNLRINRSGDDVDKKYVIK